MAQAMGLQLPAAGRVRVLVAAMAAYAGVGMANSGTWITLPAFAALYDKGLDQVAWVLTAYLLGLTALVLPAGRLGDRLGHARVYRAGMWAFLVTAAACAVAPSLEWLWVFRALQGAAAAFISTTALPLVTNSFPAAQRGRVVALVTLANSLGSLPSLYLAAWLVETAPAIWVFAFVIPPALAGLAALPRQKAAPPVRTAGRGVDWPGVGLLAAFLVTFLLSLNHLHAGEGFGEGLGWHLPMLLLSLVLLAAFVSLERRAANPILPLGDLKNRLLIAALGLNTIFHMSMMGVLVTLPFVVQTGLGLSATRAAHVLIPVSILGIIMAPLSGYLYDRHGGQRLLPVFMAELILALLLLGWMAASLSYAALQGLTVVMGVGMGLLLTTINAATMGTVGPELRGFASGMLETTRQMGHSVGSVLAGTLLSVGLEQVQRTGEQAAFFGSVRATAWTFALFCAVGAACGIWYNIERRR